MRHPNSDNEKEGEASTTGGGQDVSVLCAAWANSNLLCGTRGAVYQEDEGRGHSGINWDSWRHPDMLTTSPDSLPLQEVDV